MNGADFSFSPAPLLRNPHLQTLFASLFAPKSPSGLSWERFELEDGDYVDCLWCDKPADLSEKPIVILFHGLTGSWRSPYILRQMRSLKREGFASVLMHFRGCSGEPNRLPRSYHSGDTSDAKIWIGELKKRYPKAPLFAAGFSLGGNMLLKLLGEEGESARLCGAVAVSAPMRLSFCADRMERGFSKLYQRYLLRELKSQLLEKYDHHDMRTLLGISREEIKKLRTFRAFDDAYTAPVHGFKDAEEYYARCCGLDYLRDIRIPTLILHSKDDPFTGAEVIPQRDEISSCVSLEVSEHGGHIGFVSGTLWRPEFWLQERISRFLIQCRHQCAAKE